MSVLVLSLIKIRLRFTCELVIRSRSVVNVQTMRVRLRSVAAKTETASLALELLNVHCLPTNRAGPLRQTFQILHRPRADCFEINVRSESGIQSSVVLCQARLTRLIPPFPSSCQANSRPFSTRLLCAVRIGRRVRCYRYGPRSDERCPLAPVPRNAALRKLADSHKPELRPTENLCIPMTFHFTPLFWLL